MFTILGPVCPILDVPLDIIEGERKPPQTGFWTLGDSVQSDFYHDFSLS
jgi:hypothetical protein